MLRQLLSTNGEDMGLGKPLGIEFRPEHQDYVSCSWDVLSYCRSYSRGLFRRCLNLRVTIIILLQNIRVINNHSSP